MPVCDEERYVVGSSRITPFVAALVRHQLENLLRVIELQAGGLPIHATAYRFGRNGEASVRNSAARYDSTLAYRHVEPRLGMIACLLQNLSRLGRFEGLDSPVDIDGFALRNLPFWARYPSTRLIDNFGELSTWCNCNCEFCFLHGSRMLSPKRPMLSMKEAATRARYYSAETQTGLPTPSAPPGEPLSNPHALELLRMARQAHPDHVLDITTNGDFLTASVARALAELKPLHVSLSLNSSNPLERRRSMGSQRADIGIRAVSLLREHEIQFTGSIVPSPHAPHDDVADTMRYLDAHTPIQIRLLLPGFTKHAMPAATFETKPFWDSLLTVAQQMRDELQAPLLIQPGFYWNRNITANIDGTYPNSPAAREGLRIGDRIVSVNGQPVITRAEAGYYLETPPSCGEPWTTSVEVERGGRRWVVRLSNELGVDDDMYLYKPRGYSSSYEVLARWGFGIQLMDGFDLEPLRALKSLVERHPEARSVLIFTTPLVRELYLQALQLVGTSSQCALPPTVDVRVTVARQNFWGGNIVVGDLHVVQDYIDHLLLLARFGYRPDLAIIPNSFADSWGMDLLCRSYMEIERHTGVPVELLPVRRVMV